MSDQSLPDTPPAQGAAPGGLTAVFVDSRPVLLRFLTRRLGEAAQAEDVLQDVWIKLHEKPPTSPVADPLAYLFQVCENASRDLRRSESRRQVREANWAEHKVPGGSESDVEPSPEQVAIEREALRAVETRLQRLPERTRHIFLAFRLEGQPQKDIARQHGISLSAVQKHLQRAYRAVLRWGDENNSDDSDATGAGP